MPVTLIQLTDTHIHDEANACFKDTYPYQYLQRIIHQILFRHGQPDYVVVTGDLTHDGNEASCQHLAQLLSAFDCPVYVTAGNHDETQTIHQHLLINNISMPDLVELNHWQLLFADSHIEYETGGEIADSIIDRFRLQLKQNNKSALLFTHHPPISIDSEWMDKIGMKNGFDFLQSLIDFPQLKAVAFGHIHQQWHSSHQHIQLLGAPSTCVQFKPLSEDFAIDNNQPGYRVFSLGENGQFSSEVKRSAMHIQKIVSGGQTGVDRAALDIAIALAIPHGGWCPLGRRAEDGRLADIYQLTETPGANYAQRTEWNVRDSDGTLILTCGQPTGGTALTCKLAQDMNKPLYVADLDQISDFKQLQQWLESASITTLNIAGPRQSGMADVYDKAYNFLGQLLS
ncbi:MAG TPA: putative molybdenum carrier protein [Gammaproteobacteria bacterium]